MTLKVNPIYKAVYGKGQRRSFMISRKILIKWITLRTIQNMPQTVKKLRQRLMKYLRETNDPRLIDDGKFFETPPMAGVVKIKGLLNRLSPTNLLL